MVNPKGIIKTMRDPEDILEDEYQWFPDTML